MRYVLGDRIGPYQLSASGTLDSATSAAASSGASRIDQKAHFRDIDKATGAVNFTVDPFDPATMNPLVNVHVVWVPVNVSAPATADQYMNPTFFRSAAPVQGPAPAPAAAPAPMTPNQPAAGGTATATAPATATATAPATAPTVVSVPVNSNVQRGVPYIAQAIHEYAQ